MEEFKGTKGGWQDYTKTTIGKNRLVGFKVYHQTILIANCGKHKESEANAKLIAAAPELLTIAILVERFGSDVEGLHDKAKQVLNKIL